MSKIEIVTTQKVVIQYDLASLRERIVAFVIDTIILYLLVILLFFLLYEVFNIQRWGLDDAGYIMLVAPVFIFYNFASEVILNGQTAGKKAMGIKVIKLTGRAPMLSDYLTRWVFRPVDIYFSLGTIAYLLISSSPKSQKLGDILSNTVVVKVKPNQSISLTDLGKLPSGENYTPKYPGVIHFNDEQMLAVRELLTRVKQYRNKTHLALLRETADTLAEKLQVKKADHPYTFLQEVLQEYIILTR